MKSPGLGRGFLFGRMLELVDWREIYCRKDCLLGVPATSCGWCASLELMPGTVPNLASAGHPQPDGCYLGACGCAGQPGCGHGRHRKCCRATWFEPYDAELGGLVKDGLGYTGHVSDSATGLSYMQQRYMDPQLGVFLSVDPVTAYEQPAI
ncbi:RHS repeat domain-containing protein [Stenotrophomonas maltophilia]